MIYLRGLIAEIQWFFGLSDEEREELIGKSRTTPLTKRFKRFIRDILIEVLPKNTYEVMVWRLGISEHPPVSIGWKMMKRYARIHNLHTFIETGTFRGDTLFALKDSFDRLYSIELGANLFSDAKKRFSDCKNVYLYKGDSAEVLPKLLETIEHPALFYLDGHWSDGVTARGSKDTPILLELESILTHKVKGHVILIDDARTFIGEGDYPTISEIEMFVKRINPSLNIEVRDDKIIIL